VLSGFIAAAHLVVRLHVEEPHQFGHLLAKDSLLGFCHLGDFTFHDPCPSMDVGRRTKRWSTTATSFGVIGSRDHFVSFWVVGWPWLSLSLAGAMKHILQLALSILLAGTSATAGDTTATNPPRAVPAKIDAEFKPESGVEYKMEGGYFYHHNSRTNPGPAQIDMSRAWSFANEFVYRTALAKDYVVPAGGTGRTRDGWCQVDFTSKDAKSHLVVEVHIERRVARLPATPRPTKGSSQ